MRSPYLVLAVLAGCAPTTGAHRHDALVTALRREEQRTPPPSDDVTITSAHELDRSALIDSVLARNPDLEAARQGWRAAVEAYPAAVSLEDPMISYEVAPLSVVGVAPFGQRVELSQKLPWPGKRRRAGDAALAEAEAMQADYEAMRQELAEAASRLFDDYYLTARALEVNAHHQELLESMKKSATAQFSVGHAAEQDALQAESEIIELERDRLMLETQQATTVARINGLLHRAADASVPPPPKTLAVDAADPGDPGDTHPRVAAAEAHVRAGQAEVAMARRDFYPDIELMASYNSMWEMPEHQWMIGVAIEIPIQRGKRRAAVAAARAEQAKAEAELAGVRDAIAVDVESGRREVDEARKALDLYEDRLLPTARDRVDAALAGYTTGANDFQTVIEAEHALREAELKLEEGRAELHRRLATLERALGQGGTP